MSQQRRQQPGQDPYGEIDRELRGAPKPIEPPEVERMGAGYRALFADQRIEIAVPRVHWHKEDAVAVYAISLLPAGPGGKPKRLDHGTLNLNASRSRVTLANSLTKRWPADWDSILEQFAWAVQELEMTGDEPVELRTLSRENLVASNLLGGLCLRGNPTMVFGHGGDFKSYIAMAAGLSINSGKPLLGFEPAERLRVAYCDWEWDKNEHLARLDRLMPREEQPDLLYFRCRHALSQEVDRLAYQFRKHGVGYAIIDSVSWACGGAPEESALATAFLNALRVLDVGVLCIAHCNRSADTALPFGSVFWHNAMRATWFAKRQQEPGERTMTVGLWNRKANGDALARPLGFAIDFRDGRTKIERVSSQRVREAADEAGQNSVKDRIYLALAQNRKAMTYEELAERLSVSKETVQRTVHRHEGRAFVVLKVQGSKTHRVALPAREPDQMGFNEAVQVDSPDEPDTIPDTQTDTNQTSGSAEAELSRQPDADTPSLRGVSVSGLAGEAAVAIRCPSCGGREYRPLGDGVRECLVCENVWGEEDGDKA